MNWLGFLFGIYIYYLLRDIWYIDIIFIGRNIYKIIFLIFFMFLENEMVNSILGVFY